MKLYIKFWESSEIFSPLLLKCGHFWFFEIVWEFIVVIGTLTGWGGDLDNCVSEILSPSNWVNFAIDIRASQVYKKKKTK